MNEKVGWYRLVCSRTLTGLFVAVVVISGCWGDQSGPKRYRISGTITFRDNPVPDGMIYFDPDGSKGNNGPQGSGRIKDGWYETTSGHGAVSGPHVVRILGYEVGDAEPAELFPPYTTRVDIPEESFKVDFKVPVSTPRRRRK